MAGTSWSSSSSCSSSLGSLDDDVVCVVKRDIMAADAGVKFMCSYGGRILPRQSDGALRYVGGDNRVISVDRFLHFHELQRKLKEMCGWEAVSLRCQLPTEDLDALVSVTSDDDLAILLEEYDAASRARDRLQPLKIRAFLIPRTSPPLSPASRPTPCFHDPQQKTHPAPPCAFRWGRQLSPPVRVPHLQNYHRHDTDGEARPQRYLVQSGSHWR